MQPDRPLPALTRAEQDFLDHYLRILELLGRINPASAEYTYAGVTAAQALATEAAKLRDALTLMYDRAEKEIHREPLVRALRILGAEDRLRRLALPGPGPEPDRGSA
ncbi:hypothetical protein Ppa06_36180 [Planomonospora parontospora subsp. parontospora]|uniref:Uncharacterized protein n=2 Tax=Planomonospora parontospora TaxID=58119 RepID=A0AA37BHC4_9ACTN|nr:hypothetical protein [Planomonospora parontospora]GGK70397.1 hypothetical protein GCM10010126_32260 [Planomonospora parontospora]GII09820.1 hypothetical protein Ppa06_36180 [Planomonospora parontospora subsp. parontospora]